MAIKYKTIRKGQPGVVGGSTKKHCASIAIDGEVTVERHAVRSMGVNCRAGARTLKTWKNAEAKKAVETKKKKKSVGWMNPCNHFTLDITQHQAWFCSTSSVMLPKIKRDVAQHQAWFSPTSRLVFDAVCRRDVSEKGNVQEITSDPVQGRTVGKNLSGSAHIQSLMGLIRYSIRYTYNIKCLNHDLQDERICMIKTILTIF
jgi:hypothetical protein